jgi:hypothetical protein
MRRWYAPVNHSDEELMELQASMRAVCQASIGTLLDYPVLQVGQTLLPLQMAERLCVVCGVCA